MFHLCVYTTLFTEQISPLPPSLSLSLSLSLSEALWQPARKSTGTENRRPLYVFSTDMANAAADAVLKNRYDTIVQFHNAQPKGPGFLRLSRKDSGKRETASNTRESSESDGGGGGGRGGNGGGRAPKRRSSRLSATEEAPMTKKLRGGGQKASDNSRQTRFSRRLRKRQEQGSSSPPSSPDSADRSSSEEEEEEQGEESEVESTRSPAPVVAQRGRGGRSSGRGGRRGGGRGGGGRGRRNSSPVTNSGGRRGRTGGVEEEWDGDTEEEEEKEGEEESEKEPNDEDLHAPRNTDRPETAGDEEERGDSLNTGPTSAYGAGKGAGLPRPTPHPSQLQSVEQEGENNYTICHGTPRSKGGRVASVSSPAPHNPLSPHRRVSPMGGVSSAVPISTVSAHHTQHDIASLGVISDKQSSSSLSGASPHGHPGSGPAGRGDPMMGGASAIHPNTHHKDPAAAVAAATAANNWPAGLGPQFAHVPGGYYGAGIHPLHYPPHLAAQHVPGANYSYGVYPWGTPHPVGGHPSRDHQQQHLYGGHEGHQHRAVPSSQHLTPPQPGTSGGHFHPAHRSSADVGKDSGGGTSSHETTPSHDKQHPLSTSHSLRQLPSTHIQHQTAAAAFPRPPHPDQLSAVHPAAAAFPYGFDPNNPAALSHMHQLWQHQQQQMRAAAVHPSHLSPHLQHTAAAGMWYPHHMQTLIQHGGGGGVPPDDSAKRRALAAAAAAQQQSGGVAKHTPVDALRMNSNRNNSNCGSGLVLQPSHLALLPRTTTTALPSFQQALLPLVQSEFGSSSGEWTRSSANLERDPHPMDSFPR